jgi:alkylation response protein AidB-like acyl-CoA dehydrogenase
MDFSLSKEEQLIQKVAKEFSDDKIVPLAEEIDKTNVVPEDILQGLRDLGLFGIIGPEAYGGGGASYLSYLLAIQELSKACSGIGMILSVNNIGQGLIDYFGTEEQKKKYLPKIITGEEIFSFAFTEPGTGSDPKQLAVTATKEGDHYVLNGTKRFITNTGYKGPLVVVAKETETGKATAFIVEKFSEGYSLSEPWEKIGMHGGPLYDVYLKDLKVPEENMLGDIGQGMWVLKMAMVHGKIGVVGVNLGVSAAIREEAIEYAKGKLHRGVPIAEKFEHIRLSIADIEMKFNSAKWVAYHYAWALDNIKDDMELVKYAALAKVTVTETGVDLARIAMSITGSYGLMKDYKISRLWNDVIMGAQVEGTAPTLKVLAANAIL